MVGEAVHFPGAGKAPRRPDRAAAPTFATHLARAHTPEAIMGELRRVILSGDAPPGTTIQLDTVAAAFGVSVIPVRESLKTLVGEGLIDHQPRAGYRVARLTMAELQEFYVIRGVLEQAALGTAVLRAGVADHLRARAVHDHLGENLRDADDRAYHRGSRSFHLALVAPAGMHRLQAMLESAWNITEPYRPMSHVTEADRAQLHADHQHMLDAFVAGDAETLLTRTAEHYDHLRRAVASLPRTPELFADP